MTKQDFEFIADTVNKYLANDPTAQAKIAMGFCYELSHTHDRFDVGKFIDRAVPDENVGIANDSLFNKHVTIKPK